MSLKREMLLTNGRMLGKEPTILQSKFIDLIDYDEIEFLRKVPIW